MQPSSSVSHQPGELLWHYFNSIARGCKTFAESFSQQASILPKNCLKMPRDETRSRSEYAVSP
jgi:hypothetical protein